MKVLVIPDIHLKPWIFDQAEQIMKKESVDKAVCVMDIADEWNKQFCIDLYAETYRRAKAFAVKYPETLWCYGNHDLCYEWNQRESGYSVVAGYTVVKGLSELRNALPKPEQLSYVHLIDTVLFSHGGVCEEFVERFVPNEAQKSLEETLQAINGFQCYEMWNDWSPIWLRPLYEKVRPYKEELLFQVVGHTPVKHTTLTGTSFLTCDTFSLDNFAQPYGDNKFTIVDTISHEWYCVGVSSKRGNTNG